MASVQTRAGDALLAVWHVALVGVSLLNVALWLWLAVAPPRPVDRVQLSLATFYVFGCAFRAWLPRAGEHIVGSEASKQI